MFTWDCAPGGELVVDGEPTAPSASAGTGSLSLEPWYCGDCSGLGPPGPAYPPQGQGGLGRASGNVLGDFVWLSHLCLALSVCGLFAMVIKSFANEQRAFSLPRIKIVPL